MLVLVSVGEFLGMTLWFSATAAAPAIAAEFSIGGAGTAWLTMAVQAGFVVGTLVSAAMNLADVVNPRRLFAVGCVVGAAANAAISIVDQPAVIIALRFATGASLACVYPPGLKIVAGWFLERRGAALGIVVGALTTGSAFPHLLAWAAAGVPWRALLLTSSALALAGGTMVALTVRDGPHVTASAPFDPHAIRAVLSHSRVRLAICGYLGHMWELYAMWTWIPTFATAWLATNGGVPTGHPGSLIAFITIFSGAIGCVVAGRWADEWGKAKVAGGSMVVSAACCVLAGLTFGAAPAALLALAVVWGFSVVSDSAQFSALVSEGSPRTHVGTALTLQLCAGFLLTMASIQLMPAIAGAAGGWRWVFLALAPGPVLGSLAMKRLSALSNGTGSRKP